MNGRRAARRADGGGAGTGAARPVDVLRAVIAVSPPPWRRLALATALGLAAAAAAIGLLAGSGYVVDRAAFRPGLGAIAGLLAGVEVLAFLRAPLRYGERLAVHDAAFRALVAWRVWLYDQLAPLAPAGLARWRSGDLLRRAIDDVDALQDLYVRALAPVAVAVGAAGLALVTVTALLPTAGLVLGPALLVALLLPSLVALRGQRAASRDAERRAQMAADVVDLVEGAAELAAFGADAPLLQRIEHAAAELDRSTRRRALVAGSGAAITTACAGGAVIGVLAVGVGAVGAHHLAPVFLAVLPLAAVAAFEPVPAVAAAALRVRDVVGAGRRLLDLAGRTAPVVDPPDPEALPAGSSVEAAGLRLRYGDRLPWALDGLDLVLPAHRRVAVVGPSGAGKTSLVQALLRLWPFDGGSLRLGGTLIERLTQADVRRRVTLVDHDATLFAGTLRHNLTLGRPDASDAEIAAALHRAQLADWVASLPDGLATAVGERGSRLSGGQRQRVAVARALLTGAPVLVLDEPTAGLDAPTAQRLLDAVLDHPGGGPGAGDDATSGDRHSVLLVTHEDVSKLGLDAVVTMEAGRAVGDPPPAIP